MQPYVHAHVLSVQVGRPRDYEWLGRTLRTSIVKHPVAGPVAVRGVNLEGDDQADRAQHGGADKAVYAYAREDALWWEGELGRPVEPGSFGANLKTLGLALRAAVVGETRRIGPAGRQVSEPRTPCWKLGMRMGDAAFPRRFAKARRTGVLLRILQEGVLQAGDAVRVDSRPAHGVTVAAINAVYYGESRDLTPVFAAPELAAHWRGWAEHRTVWHLDEERRAAQDRAARATP